MGCRVWVTSRDEQKGEWAVGIGADEAFPTGERLPDKVDAVIETVGEATWDHSLKSLRPGGIIVVSGATSGPMPPAQLNRVFFLQLTVAGSTMGTAQEFRQLIDLMSLQQISPIIDRTLPMTDAREGLAAMKAGWRTDGITGPGNHLPQLINPMKHFYWILRPVSLPPGTRKQL